MQYIQNDVLGLCLSLWKADIPEHISVMVRFHLSAFFFYVILIVHFLNAMNELQGWKDTSESY